MAAAGAPADSAVEAAAGAATAAAAKAKTKAAQGKKTETRSCYNCGEVGHVRGECRAAPNAAGAECGKAPAAVVSAAGALGTPMTYMHEDKQYIALTVGGDVPELLALALP